MQTSRASALLFAAFFAGVGFLTSPATSREPSAEAALTPWTIRVDRVAKDLPLDPLAVAWKAVKPTAVRLHPQTTAQLNDRITNQAMRQVKFREAVVRALSDGDRLAVHVSWSDPTRSLLTRTDTDLFGDSVAIEVPLRFAAGESLPYVGMGDDKHPVAVYMQRAVTEGTYQRRYVGEGFGSLTPIDAPGVQMQLAYDERVRAWNAVFVLPVLGGPVRLDQALVPMAFAVWDGENRERGGNKTLSSWQFLRQSQHPVDPVYLDEISWGKGPGPVGDAVRGKTLMGQYCIACHRFADQQVALVGMAPDLSSVGGIAHPRYLRDSIVDPGAIVIRNLNINRHYDVNGERDRFGAYPNNELYAWYARDAEGGRISKMPPFKWLPEQDVNDMVAYLMTLSEK